MTLAIEQLGLRARGWRFPLKGNSESGQEGACHRPSADHDGRRDHLVEAVVDAGDEPLGLVACDIATEPLVPEVSEEKADHLSVRVHAASPSCDFPTLRLPK
ncbi:hypothetical protein [Methylobacterium nonmethylotrophicum]|uniref:Uncharacterized protein n=1 Tax=Methylobacterium nonmethylotrophicum TaxID=1141884 RepID=A0A4Z0NI56_9HYPH|nr:hypothetical protein [Methylobacterium nonmethylotrophicum]TGD95364.1 hypothetical protein EU555_28520 [Methylobacterium nonmethylotrophicum]